MASKLTLSIDSKVIEAAKKFSARTGTSISKMVEDYLRNLTLSDHKKRSTRNSLMQLKGILGKVPKDFDFEEERFRYLTEKYK
jgi:hypothetical protein